VRLESLTINDFRSVLQALHRVRPDEVYNLAGQSSVALSFEQPVETLESISVGTLNLLEAIRFTERPIRFYNAGSGECFGDTREPPTSRLRSAREVPTRLQSPPRTGRSRTTPRHMGFTHARAFSSTTSRHCGQSDS
jgi:GDPmannose 4,6-dehydratase